MNNTRHFGRRGLEPLFLLAGFAVVTALVTVVHINRTNNLANNGHWQPTKPLRNMLQSDSFYTESQILAENALNLGAWGGFQEVLYKTPVTLAALSCRFRLEREAYLCVLFDRQDDQFWGIRFSANEKFPNILFRCDAKGCFLTREPISLPLLTQDIWHSLHLSPNETGLEIRLDDRELSVQVHIASRSGKIGFRNGFRNATVDDVRIVDAATGAVYSESFDAMRNFGRGLRHVLPRAAAVFAAFLLLVFLVVKSWRKVFEHAIAVMLTLIATGAVFAIFHFYVLAKLYPVLPPVVGNYAFSEKDIQERAQRILSQSARIAPDGGRRVLFLGTSQVAGTGANVPSEAYVSVLEELVNDRCENDPPVHAINGGMGGYNLELILKAYKEYLRDCEADVTVLSLACNDSGMGVSEERFAADLKELVHEVRAGGSTPVFVVEASAAEQVPDGFRLDRELCRVGNELGIPVIDANAYLRERYDTGFLYVDLVHPTSYGHRLVAECLVGPIAEVLGVPDCAQDVITPQ